MAEKIMLIDGNSIINRAFYGVPLLTNAEGRYTNAVYGFFNILFKLLDEDQPDYLAVAFDMHAPTFRHKTFDGYKGTRKGMPERLFKCGASECNLFAPSYFHATKISKKSF